MRSQTAVELLVVLAIGLIVIGIIFVSSYERLAGSQAALQVAEAQAAASDLAKAADTVWLEGAGAKKKVFVDLPEGINDSMVSGNTIRFKVAVPGGLTDVAAKSSALLFGSIPLRTGGQWVIVSATESGVRIGAQDLDVDPSILITQVVTSNATQNTQASFNASNLGNASIDVSATLVWSNGTVNVSFSNPGDSYFTLAPGAYRTITLNKAIGPNVLGSFSGNVFLNASNGDEAVVDIVVEVVPPYCAACPTCPSCPPANVTANVTENVSWFEIRTYLNSSYTVEKLAFGPDTQAEIISVGAWNASTPVTLNITYPNGTIVPGYPKTINTTGIGTFSDTWVFQAGVPTGVYYVWANQTPWINSTTFNLTC